MLTMILGQNANTDRVCMIQLLSIDFYCLGFLYLQKFFQYLFAFAFIMEGQLCHNMDCFCAPVCCHVELDLTEARWNHTPFSLNKVFCL